MPDRILIWGCGGHGKVVADLARACGYEVAGYVDSDVKRLGHTVEPGGAQMVASPEQVNQCLHRFGALPGAAVAIVPAIGDNSARMELMHAVGRYLARPLVHPTAVVSPSATIGNGSVVLAGAIVNAAAQIGECVILNSACVIEHDCHVASASHVSPGAVLAGGARIGERTWVGAGAVLIQQVRVANDVIVGAGAVVLRDVAEGQCVVGTPARPLPGRNPTGAES